MKFTIRDLFLVTLVVALAVGWGVDHRAQFHSRQNAERGAQILQLRMIQDGYKVGWDGQQNMPIIVSPDELPTSQAPSPISPRP